MLLEEHGERDMASRNREVIEECDYQYGRIRMVNKEWIPAVKKSSLESSIAPRAPATSL